MGKGKRKRRRKRRRRKRRRKRRKRKRKRKRKCGKGKEEAPLSPSRDVAKRREKERSRLFPQFKADAFLASLLSPS